MPKGTGSYALFDTGTHEVRLFSRQELGKKLSELSQLLKSHVAQLEDLGKYELESFTVTVGLKGGLIVFTAEGGISLRYHRKKT
jgi:hypothetical protein